MTLAKVQQFCIIYGLDLGVYDLNSKKILPFTVKKKQMLALIQEPFLCNLEKKRKTSLIHAVKEVEIYFRYEETEINDNILKYWLNIDSRYRMRKVSCVKYLFLIWKLVLFILQNTVRHMELEHIILMYCMSNLMAF